MTTLSLADFDPAAAIDEWLKSRDIAAVNLACAVGLPGAEDLDVERYLNWLDDAARQVQFQTDRLYYQYLESPEKFEHSQARFCMASLVTILQHLCGVRYNPKWQDITADKAIPAQFGADARDTFIHAIMDGIGGTYGSLPVLFVAIGRRLGYPLKIVKAKQHLFVRWDDPEGNYWHRPERFNMEATGPGIHFLPDDEYRTWPQPIPHADIDAGIYLKSLTPREELAEFLATRGCCLCRNRRYAEAADVFARAVQLSPHNHRFASTLRELRTAITMRNRGHAYLNAERPIEYSGEPFWMNDDQGHRMLVQIFKPSAPPFPKQPFGALLTLFGEPMMQQPVTTPHGLTVDALVPLTGVPTALNWVRLPDGRFALVHKPDAKPFGPPMPTTDSFPGGHPALSSPGVHGPTSPMPNTFNPFQVTQLSGRIQSANRRQQQVRDQQDASFAPLSLPGPAAPRLPAAASLLRLNK